MSETYYDPYAKRRRQARLARQAALEKVVTAGLPIDGNPREVRRPVRQAGDLFGAAIDSWRQDFFPEEAAFFDTLREKWATLFPNCPARPGRWQENKIVLYVTSAGQSFALRPRLAAMKKVIRSLPGAPKGPWALLVEIHAKEREHS